MLYWNFGQFVGLGLCVLMSGVGVAIAVAAIKGFKKPGDK